jgi:hypothetical protein
MAQAWTPGSRNVISKVCPDDGPRFGGCAVALPVKVGQAGQVGRGFHAAGVSRDQVVADAAGSGFGQQLLDDHFRLLVLAFAEMVMPDTPLHVGEVQRGPVVTVEGTPYRVVVVDRDRVVDPHAFHGAAYVIHVVLERELVRRWDIRAGAPSPRSGRGGWRAPVCAPSACAWLAQ